MHDLRFAVRTLLKDPAFTAVAVVTLALGIGVNAIIFGAVNGLLVKPLPVREPQRLVGLFTLRGEERTVVDLSYPRLRAHRDLNPAFEGVVGQHGTEVSLTVGERAEMVWGELVTPDYFSVLGVEPALGRLLLPADDRGPGSAPYVVLSHAFWETRFASDPRVVGRTLRVNGNPFTVVGVAPRRFTCTRLFAFLPDLWVPLNMHAQVIPGSEEWLEAEGRRFLITLARLKPGVTVPQAQEASNALAARLAAERPSADRETGVWVMPAPPPFAHPGFVPRETMTYGAALGMAGVGLVLVVACANVAGLLLARATARRREIAIRLALGASRGRLVRQLLIETLLLASLGGGAGLLLAAWGTELRLLVPPSPFRLDFEAGLDLTVLGFTAAVSVASALLAGLVPALQASRGDLLPALKDAAPLRGFKPRRLDLRRALVSVQLAVCLVILIAGGLLLKSLRGAQRMDVGFNTDGAVMLSVNPGLRGYDQARGLALYRRLLERARSVPGIESATLAYPLPLDFSTRGTSVVIEGREAPPGEETVGVLYSVVDESYFQTLQTPLVKGRGFVEADGPDAPRVVVVNQTMAQRYWPGQDPLGRRMWFAGPSGEFLQVVGVARDGKYVTLGESPRPYMFLPLRQNFMGRMTLVARSSADPAPVTAALRREVAALDSDLPVFGVATLGEFRRRSLSAAETSAALSAAFGLLALTLSAVGIYGVVAYTVARRTREFGVRMALGAQRVDVLRLVLAGGLRLGAAGVVLGLLGAWAASRLLAGVLYGVSATDPLIFAAVPVGLFGLVLLASVLPASRAARTDPLTALRYE